MSDSQEGKVGDKRCLFTKGIYCFNKNTTKIILKHEAWKLDACFWLGEDHNFSALPSSLLSARHPKQVTPIPTILPKYRHWELAACLLNHTKPHQLA